MVRWGGFVDAAPTMADEGLALIDRSGDGLGFLATVRPDGGPRVHPVAPFVADGGLFVMLGDSPKRRDLRRDPRYALHTASTTDTDDEFYVVGSARPVETPEELLVVEAAIAMSVPEGYELFELGVDRALHARYERKDTWRPPRYTRWPEPSRCS